MNSIYLRNNPELKSLRRLLRKNQTDAENRLWGCLRGKQLNGLKFFRQYGVGNYILDFYCPEFKLAIELDGSQHLYKVEYDRQRTKFLNERGIHVVRFWDNEILTNLEGILQFLLREISNPSQPPLNLRGGG